MGVLRDCDREEIVVLLLMEEIRQAS